MRGTNASTGKPVSGLDHLRQSIRDVLTTPVGTRVMRRDYGSRLFELVDAPLNQRTTVDFYQATFEALLRWVPQIEPRRVALESSEAGRVVLTLEATDISSGAPITLDGITITA